MNKARRGKIQKALKKLEEIGKLLDSLKDDVQAITDEEQEAFDNLPESLQEADRGQKSQNAIDCLENAISFIECDGMTLMDDIENALAEAKE